MKEEWGLTIGKGLMVGLLTAIPISLPSFAFLPPGVLGTIAILTGGRSTAKGNKDGMDMQNNQ